MSMDFRIGVAYFGRRERVYSDDTASELPNAPRKWRQILSWCYEFPIRGSQGLEYPTMYHALMSYRIMYCAENNPVISQICAGPLLNSLHTCSKWTSPNNMSVLQLNPDENIWFIMRERICLDLVLQRLYHDTEFRDILRQVVEQGLIPVYHLRTAKQNTSFWGGCVELASDIHHNSTSDRTVPQGIDVAVQRIRDKWQGIPMQGKNMLGNIYLEAYRQFTRFYQQTTLAHSISTRIRPKKKIVFPTQPVDTQISTETPLEILSNTAAEIEATKSERKRTCESEQTGAVMPNKRKRTKPKRKVHTTGHQASVFDEESMSSHIPLRGATTQVATHQPNANAAAMMVPSADVDLEELLLDGEFEVVQQPPTPEDSNLGVFQQLDKDSEWDIVLDMINGI